MVDASGARDLYAHLIDIFSNSRSYFVGKCE
jgi:hypothetical protein